MRQPDDAEGQNAFQIGRVHLANHRRIDDCSAGSLRAIEVGGGKLPFYLRPAAIAGRGRSRHRHRPARLGWLLSKDHQIETRCPRVQDIGAHRQGTHHETRLDRLHDFARGREQFPQRHMPGLSWDPPPATFPVSEADGRAAVSLPADAKRFASQPLPGELDPFLV